MTHNSDSKIHSECTMNDAKIQEDVPVRTVKFTGIEQPASQNFCDNSIKTSKYNVASFLPVSLLEQFRRQGNQYFLLMSVLMLIGTYVDSVFQSPIQPWTTLGPLIVVLAISLLQEGYADFKRHKADDEVNNRLVRITNRHQTQTPVQKEGIREGTQMAETMRRHSVLKGFQGDLVKWRHLSCGNFVVLKNGDQLPADLVLVASSEAEGIAYVETSQIDGETNLKLRRAAAPAGVLPEFDPQNPKDPYALLAEVVSSLRSVTGTVVGELPNPRINTYEGNLVIASKGSGLKSTPTASVHTPMGAPGESQSNVPDEKANEQKTDENAVTPLLDVESQELGQSDDQVPLSNENIMLRGSSLRNTSWAIGITIFTGKQTKVVLNSRKAPSKLSQIDRAINRAIQIIFLSDILLTLLSAALNYDWEARYFDKSEYLGYGSGSRPTDGRLYWADMEWQEDQLEYYKGFLTFLVLYNNFIPISMYVTVEIVVFILLYYVNNDKEMYYQETDTAAKARSSNVTDLGQIQYIFSDKTGTLTQNVMRFKRCSVAGRVYGGPLDVPNKAAEIDASKSKETFSQQEVAYEQLEALSVGSHEFEESKTTKVDAISDTQPQKPMNQRSTLSASQLNVDLRATQEMSLSNGTTAQPINPPPKDMEAIDDFLKILCLCNTVVVEKDKDGITGPDGKVLLAYQAESPDEAALVDAAKNDFNYELKGRTTQDITAIINGSEVTYSILAVNKFDSYRKRMSIILEDKLNKRRWMLCKGADTAMLGEGCVSDKNNENELKTLNAHLDMFASEGLRTLVCGIKEIGEQEWDEWHKTYHDALTALKDRDEKVTEAADLMEKNMKIIGATAIEDKLQDGVPDTIADLAKAGIKLWVLTGDKRQTAINIGFSCKVLRDNMNIQTLTAGDEEFVRKQLVGLFLTFVGNKHIPKNNAAMALHHLTWSNYNPSWLHRGEETKSRIEMYKEGAPIPQKDSSKELALILEGPGLIHILGDDALEWMLFQVAKQCNTVIACRVSPKQKAMLVQMVKKYISPTPVTLAIGDGANDVNMIQEAQVGVGISGNEGQQAVNSADFAIAQFCFLKRLLLVHGRWNYRRVAKVVLYSLCKNLVLVVTLFFFGLYNGFSGTPVYDQYLISLFNFYLGLPIIAVGVFDRDIKDTEAMENPSHYSVGRTNGDMTNSKILVWIVTALIHGVFVFWGSFLMFSGKGVNNAYDLATYGTLAFSVLIITMNYKVMVEHKSVVFCTCPCKELDENKTPKSWRSCCSTFGWSIFFVLLSIFGYFLSVLVYGATDAWEPANFLGVGSQALGLPLHWLYVLLIPTSAVAIEIIGRYSKEQCFGSKRQKGPAEA